ncbi:MAG: hypothetical protein ACI8YQ_002586 [Polaribacter sp.]|jgi:hypothetical protein
MRRIFSYPTRKNSILATTKDCQTRSCQSGDLFFVENLHNESSSNSNAHLWKMKITKHIGKPILNT